MKTNPSVIACYLYKGADDNEVWDGENYGNHIHSLEFVEYISTVASEISAFLDLELGMRVFSRSRRVTYSHILCELIYPMGKLIGVNWKQPLTMTTIMDKFNDNFNDWHGGN